MLKKIDSLTLSSLYVILILLSFFSYLYEENMFFWVFRNISWIILVFMYYLKSSHNSIIKVLYILMLSCVSISSFFYSNSDNFITNYNTFFYIYLISHIAFLILIYKQKNSSFTIKDIVIFSLPFLFANSIILAFLWDYLSKIWILKSFFLVLIASMNSSIIMINYLKKSTIDNYLLFLGVFVWFLSDIFSIIFVFYVKNDLFFLLFLMLNWMAQLMICRAQLGEYKINNNSLNNI